jgi:putative transposase
MARPLRLEYAGAVYHVTSRGNARLPVFEDDEDRECFLGTLAEAVGRWNWLCHAYCLMDNHYHLLLETPDGNLSRGMRHLNGVYTQRFNRRHHRTGHLFQGRYKSVVVDRDGYLLELCRYVVLNPVRAGMVSGPGEYRWSSFRSTAGLEQCPNFLTVDWLLGQFGKRRKDAQEYYVRFIRSGLLGSSPWRGLKSQCVLGSADFMNRIEPALRDKALIEEIPRDDRLAFRPSLEGIVQAAHQDRAARNQAMLMAHLDYGYTLAQIARALGLHYTTVSKVVKNGVKKN